MKRLVALNTSRGTVIADRVGVAMTRAERAVGLLSRTGLEPGEALWIVPSRGVHTWGMRFTIDVLALDEEGIVIDCVSNLKPWRVRLPRKGTAGVLELPAGRLAESGTGLGHRILFETTEEPLSRLDAARRDPERVEGPRPLTQPQELAG
jgi:uncharacterized protein